MKLVAVACAGSFVAAAAWRSCRCPIPHAHPARSIRQLRRKPPPHQSACAVDPDSPPAARGHEGVETGADPGLGLRGSPIEPL